MEGVAMFDSSKTQLTSNEVVIPCNFAYDEYDNYIDSKISFYRYYGYYDEGAARWVDDYRYEVNGIYYYSQAEAKVALSNALNELFPNGLKVTIKEPYNENSTPVEYNVAGVYFSSLVDTGYYSYSIFFKDVESVPTKMQHNFGTYKSIITKMLGDESKDFELVSYLSAYDSTDDALVIKSQVSDILENFLETIEMLAQVFLYIGIAFAVFSALLLMNFISISISYKKQEIGILRALGAKGSDVYNIFLNESLIITFINYLVSLFLTIGGIFLINNLMKQELGFYLTLLSFGLRQVILLAAVSLIVALVATFLPTFKVSRMKPIDAIHNRK
jgi:ABC-type antimicrobial peptide transport system permease subunit